MNKLELSGDSNTPALPISDAEVNHLRRLLAWLRVEYTLDPDMQRGYLSGAQDAVRLGIATEEAASAIVQKKADEINRCPAYVRQAVKMLTKALRDYEQKAGIMDCKADQMGEAADCGNPYPSAATVEPMSIARSLRDEA